MRTTLTLDDDVLRAAKSLAEAERKTVGQVVSELARRGLRPQPAIASEAGIPVFDVPSDLSPLTPEMVRAALDD